MRLFDRQTTWILAIICLPLLFLPKINVLNLSEGETAGLRVDDLLLFAFSFILMWAHFSTRNTLIAIEAWILAIVGFSLFSWLSNRILFSLGLIPVSASLFYCVRLLEYFLFFYIGMLAAASFKTRQVIALFLIWNVLLMFLQKFGLIGEFNSVTGYTSEATYRVSGIASFPSEMGALLNIIFCYFLFEDFKHRSPSMYRNLFKQFFHESSFYWLFLIFAILVILTGSRIALVGLLVPFLFRVKQELCSQTLRAWTYAVIFLSAFAIILTVFIYQTDSISGRSKGLLSWQNIDLIATVWNTVDVTKEWSAIVNIVNEGYDLSWWLRIHKWCFGLKAFFSNPECYLQGLGPGFAGAALDGGLLRIFIEYGIVGSLIFAGMFASIYNTSLQLKWITSALLINMIFFDAYLAYKLMSLLFFIQGSEMSKRAICDQFQLTAKMI